ncbi:MAG TPA: hypothetical protein VMU92_07645 [Acidobacteriaceae bacterium]|nr:hypothetical protein [Acidobacteriaceae bacterium]
MAQRVASRREDPHANDAAIKPEPAPGKPEHPASVQHIEPEDPRHLGSSKPMQRELLKQNVERGQSRPHPESVAGQHSTGSFTGGDRNRANDAGKKKVRG